MNDFNFVPHIEKSIAAIPDDQLAHAVVESRKDLEERDPVFMTVAAAIVEPIMPQEMADAYHRWTDNDVANWENWIHCTFGADWGRIAYIIANEGY